MTDVGGSGKVTSPEVPVWLTTWLACAGSAPTGDGTPPPTDDAGTDGASETADTGPTPPGTGPCGISVPATDPDAVTAGGLVLEVDAQARPIRARPVDLGGPATVTASGPFALLASDGAPLGADGRVTDGRFLVVATAAGTGSLDVTCDTWTTIGLTGVPPVPLAGQALDDFPFFETTWDLVNAGSPVDVLVDPDALPDRVGLSFDAVLVPHRDAAAWAADPSLDDAVDTASGTVDGSSVALTAGSPPAGELLRPFDVVIDFGADGRLDPGDLLDGLDAPAVQAVGDLSAPGPHTPVHTDVSGGTYWIQERVYAPADVDTLGQLPLVVISHGNGHEYYWYDWLGDHLASHGYVVMSHRNNTEPGPVAASQTTLDNLDWFLTHLDTIVGGRLQGHVDSHTIVLVGHSRGGEGVVLAYDQLVRGAQSFASFSASDIVFVSSIAPTLFQGPDEADPHAVPYHILSGSADGDVTGGVDQGLTQYYRIFQHSTGLGLVTYVEGADHNDFNCCGAEDSAWVPAADRGPLIGRPATQQIARAYYLATLEALLHGQDVLWEVDQRAPEHFRPIGVASPLATQIERADGDRVLVIDDFQSHPEPDVSSSGAAVAGDVHHGTEGPLDDGNRTLTWMDSDPMNGMSWADQGDADPARGVVFDWDDGDDLSLDFSLPAGASDVTGYRFLSFRAAQGSRHPNVVEPLLSYSVALVDGAGHESRISSDAYARVVRPYERGGLGSGTGWVDEFQTVRIPLAAFARDGVLDLGDVRSVRFLFGVSAGSPHGRVALDDLELVQGATP